MEKKNSIGLLVAWNLTKKSVDDYYISGTHYSYLNFIATKYEQIYLLSTVSERGGERNTKVIKFANVKIVELPFAGSYLGAQKNVLEYYRQIKRIAGKVDVFYCRVPDPFCWMPALVFHKKTIMHFVGDTIDATKYNEKWSPLRKKIMIAGYYPDYLLTIKAAKRSVVYTNGYHLAHRLKKYGVEATPVVSSTVSEKIFDDNLPDLTHRVLPIRLIYVGYIRFAKGMNCLMSLCKKLKDERIDFVFDVVGAGEMFDDLKKFVTENDLTGKVILHGHVDNKVELFQKMRNADLFFFPSLSEGSPRVVIEAMSQGIPVISTPVGSLPTTFEDKKEIRFFDFNDYVTACEIVKEYQTNREPFVLMRDKAYGKVKANYTIEAFLGKIFGHELVKK